MLAILTILLMSAQPSYGKPDALELRTLRLAPSIKDWKIAVLNETDWFNLRRRYEFLDTDIAATEIKARVTLLRRRNIEKLNDSELKHVLQHEAGHIICQCNDENTADKVFDLTAKTPVEASHQP